MTGQFEAAAMGNSPSSDPLGHPACGEKDRRHDERREAMSQLDEGPLNITPRYDADCELDKSVRVNMAPGHSPQNRGGAMGLDVDDLPPTLAGEGLRVGAGAGADTPTGSAPTGSGQSPASPASVGGKTEIDITPRYDANGWPNDVAR